MPDCSGCSFCTLCDLTCLLSACLINENNTVQYDTHLRAKCPNSNSAGAGLTGPLYYTDSQGRRSKDSDNSYLAKSDICGHFRALLMNSDDIVHAAKSTDSSVSDV